jgi:large subunit ribosomal protein L6
LTVSTFPPVQEKFDIIKNNFMAPKMETLLTSTSIKHKLTISPHVLCQTTITKEGCELLFNSKRGDIRIFIPSKFQCSLAKQTISLNCTNPQFQAEFKTLVGALYQAMLGVTKGYCGKLKTVGVGYKGELEENRLIKMALGYSHPVNYFLNSTTKVKFSKKNNRFNLQGPNPLIVNQISADLHSFKRPDVYKGKGVRYRGLKLLKKEGKKKK